MKKDQESRMKDLVKKMEQVNEIYKEEDEVNQIDESVLSNNKERFSKLVDYRETNKRNENQAGQIVGGYGKTVNSAFDNQVTNNVMRNSYNMPSMNSAISPNEAFEISIKRALDSGEAVNNISFYDEINLNLQRMGFNAKSPLDIKNAINNLIRLGSVG